MIKYELWLDQEVKAQPILAFLFNKWKIIGAFVLAILSIISFVLINVSTVFGILSFVFAIFSINLFLFWVRRSRVRTYKIAALYRSQETKVFTYTLSESDGVIRDYCNELKTANEHKRSTIKRAFLYRDTIFVIYITGEISVYQNTEEIRKFFNI